MKIFRLIGILAVISSSAAFGQNKIQPETPASWRLLSEQNYSISYPDSWKLNKSGQMGTSFILFSPLSSEQDKFKENVNLIVQDLTGHKLDLDQYVEISEGQIKTMLTDGNIIESKRIKTETLHYHKIIYSGKQGIFNLKFEQYYWVVDDQAYVLTLTCEKNQFDNYQAVAEKILDSFSLN